MKDYNNGYSRLIGGIEELTRGKKSVIVAIDGHSAAGKSTLAEKLSQSLSESDCNVFHMDDFFLQPYQRTSQRLRETGGNIDYERFAAEVLSPLRAGQGFTYRKYDCGLGNFSDKIAVKPRPVNIIEGVYSMHPYFGDVYDLKVFIEIDEREQLRRLQSRNAELYNRFVNEWLPAERDYFKVFAVAEKCDIINGN